MRALEQGIAGLRAQGRRLRGRLGLTTPAWVRPARLDLSLAPPAGDWGPSDWRRLLIRAVDWLGPVPVTIYAPDQADDAALPDLIRFAHRLECPVTLVTNGRGIDGARAEELLDHGLRAVVLTMAGVSDPLQLRCVGATAVQAHEALRALAAARVDRGLPLDIRVQLCWEEGVAAEARAAVGLARQAGADGYAITLPEAGAVVDPDEAALLDLAGDGAADNFTAPHIIPAYRHLRAAGGDGPGVPRATIGLRGQLPCPIGGERLAVNRAGALFACPHKAPIVGRVGDVRADFAAGAAAHLAAIRRCDRACAAAALAPTPVCG